MNCFQDAMSILTGEKVANMPSAPTLQKVANDPDSFWDMSTWGDWSAWLAYRGLRVNMTRHYPRGKACIATFYVLDDPEMVWLHSTWLEQDGSVDPADPYFAGSTIDDILVAQSAGAISLGEFVTIEKTGVDKTL